ncbi:MAG TPA: enoyl-CoA hydratase/isomerase family protein [Kofleriaceae bacterium]
MEPLILQVPERLHTRGVAELARGLATCGDASVVVLTGEPGTFCAGMDFGETTEREPAATRAKLSPFADLIAAIATCARPTLAAIDGAALGGGLGLAAACDYVLASDRARFGLPEALYGLAPSIIRPALETRLTAGQLRMLLFTGYSRDAAEAARLGLVDEVVEVSAFAAAQRRMIRQLGRARTASIVVARGWRRDLAEALRMGVEETTAALHDPAVRAALSEEVPWAR